MWRDCKLPQPTYQLPWIFLIRKFLIKAIHIIFYAMKKLLFTLILSMGFVLYGKSQQIPSPEAFKVSAEFRPRAEVRNGYRHLRNDTTRAAFFISQRSRIHFHYQRPGLIFHTSIQDVRVWGEDDPRSTDGTL